MRIGITFILTTADGIQIGIEDDVMLEVMNFDLIFINDFQDAVNH